MKKHLILKIAFFYFLAIGSIFSQESQSETELEEGFKKNSISLAIMHTNIRSGVGNSIGDKWIVAPSFALNYNFNFNEK